MAIGTVTIGMTPCCGAIERTYETWPDEVSPTGMVHSPGSGSFIDEYPERAHLTLKIGPYAPAFEEVAAKLDRGICPDCGRPITRGDKTMTITAQQLYDRRSARAEIDGNDLHKIFRAVCGGEPSPSGSTRISADALRTYAQQQRETYAAHKANGGVDGKYLLDVARFCEDLADPHGKSPFGQGGQF
jgi:hypothetical protein